MPSSSTGLVETRLTGARGGTPVLMCVPEAAGRHPCITILHERYGLVPHTEDLARRLATEGFVVAAPDLFFDFPDQEALHRGDAGVKPSDDEVLLRCEDAFALFTRAAGADPTRFGMIGVCQTGRYPLAWATRHPIQAAITIYGAAGLQNWAYNDKHPDGIDKLLSKMNKDTEILGLFGEADHVISIDDVLRFRNAIELQSLSYQMTIYPDAPHGWLNDTMPGRYRPEAARAAWSEMLDFLRRRLAPSAKNDAVRWTFKAAKRADYEYTRNVRYE